MRNGIFITLKAFGVVVPDAAAVKTRVWPVPLLTGAKAPVLDFTGYNLMYRYLWLQ